MRNYGRKPSLSSISKTRRLSLLALLAAIAIVLNYIENLLALPFGIRFGFANVIAMSVITLFGVNAMLLINVIRVLISGLLSGIFMSYPWFMSVAGVTLSSIALILLSGRASVIFTGIICAIAHDVGQILVLSMVISSQAFVPYLGVMIVFSLVTGTASGMISNAVTKRILMMEGVQK